LRQSSTTAVVLTVSVALPRQGPGLGRKDVGNLSTLLPQASGVAVSEWPVINLKEKFKG